MSDEAELIRKALLHMPPHWHYHEGALAALAKLEAEVERLRELLVLPCGEDSRCGGDGECLFHKERSMSDDKST